MLDSIDGIQIRAHYFIQYDPDCLLAGKIMFQCVSVWNVYLNFNLKVSSVTETLTLFIYFLCITTIINFQTVGFGARDPTPKK